MTEAPVVNGRLVIGGTFTARGLWLASDTSHIGHETHQRIALLPR